MKLLTCTGKLVDNWGKPLTREGEIYAAVPCGGDWLVFSTVLIGGRRYVDTRSNGRLVSDRMLENHFE